MDNSSSTGGRDIQPHVYESKRPISSGLSFSPSSNVSNEPRTSPRVSQDSTPDDQSFFGPEFKHDEIMHPSLESDDAAPLHKVHIVRLSAIEHCMPRAYIRVCLAYRLAEDVDIDVVVGKLNGYTRKLVDAKPYLAGFVVPAIDSTNRVGLSEIRYTDEDFLNFPRIEVRNLSYDEIPSTYDELDAKGLPPSVIRPELVSALPEGTDDQLAPTFRMQANVIKGGLIVSVYLHHCVADGTGLQFLLTGEVLKDQFAFDRHLEANGRPTPSLNTRLESFARLKTFVRQKLSYAEPNQITDRTIHYRKRGSVVRQPTSSPAGRGCLVQFPREKLKSLHCSLQAQDQDSFMSPNDVLQALLWHHMTQARIPSIKDSSISRSKLLIPVNIREKLKDPIPKSYLGAAVDFASVELSFQELSSYTPSSLLTLASTALAIRRAIKNVDEGYIRQAIALSLVEDPEIDVRDLMASNMNRSEGADMYITSWEKLRLYDAELEMGIGQPDWVRKPWSKDPGSCVIMPSDERKPYLEVLIQMTEVDMERLLADDLFREYFVGTID